MNTKVLLVSSFEPWSIGLSYLRAFRKLKCEPVCFDMTEEYRKTTPLTKNSLTNSIISPYVAWVMNRKLLGMAKDCNPDLIFIHKGQRIFSETLKKIKLDTQALLFIFNPDDPFNTNRGASSRFIRDSIPIYDLYFIWSKALMAKLKHRGARCVEYLPFACDPESHYQVSLTEEDRETYGSDIVFIGNWDKERERWLSLLEGYNLAIWGSGYWRKRCQNKFLRLCWRGRTAIGSEMSTIVQASKINLNILRIQNKGSHNMRTFEIPACGGFMLHERSGEVVGFFEERKEADYFDSAEELKDKIRFYLDKDDLRAKIARAGHERCATGGYLYSDRAKQILKIYEKLRGI